MRLNSQSLANLAAVVMCSIVAAVGVRQLRAPLRPSVEPKATALTIGERIESFDSIALGAHGTAIVAFSTQCKFCVASVPFYKTLAELDRMDGTDLRFVILAMEDLQRVTEYNRDHSIGAHAVLSFPRTRPVEIRGTPTLIVLDGGGRLKKSWIGQLTKKAEAEVIATLLGY